MSFGKRRIRRHGIVLLIALGMLSLFSVLIVSFVVFSSQQNQIAVSASQQRTENIDPSPIFDVVINKIVSGDSDPTSPTYHEDLLGDLWGTDHLRLRVAHQRGDVAPSALLDFARRGMLLDTGYLTPSVANDRESTLFKFPIHLAAWHRDGGNGPPFSPYSRELFRQVAPRVLDTLDPLVQDQMPPAYAGNRQAWLQAENLPDYRLNDVFAGRLVTFLEGPLANHTFRVIRSFGTAPASGSTPDQGLAGCLVIDLAEMGESSVEFNGELVDVLQLASLGANALLYHAGADGAPGVANFDDDTLNGVDDLAELGSALSDDIGYRFLMNGVPFNGRGRNALGANLVSIPTSANPANPALDETFDDGFGRELLPNQRITGVSRQSQTAEPDEVYDAADFDNWFLSWQPSDHRAILPQVAALTGLSPQSAPSVIPSFHRPSVINYLMNARIYWDDNGDGTPQPTEWRSFPSFTGTLAGDAQRLRILYQRIRAACYRPLNFEHQFFPTLPSPPGRIYSDLNRDGNSLDGSPDFSGSNPVAVLNTPIDTANFNTAKNALRDLATWLINGPWDVDNDGDGISDSLWLDFSLPEQTLADGTIIRPLVAPLIEDLDGRINLNRAGTWSQLTGSRFNGINPVAYASSGFGGAPDRDYFFAAQSARVFGRGGGVGPAEIDFSHLFDEYPFAPAARLPFQPDFFTQTSNPRLDVLRTRVGNLFQSRYGGIPYDFASNINQFPVAMPGQEVGPAGQPYFSDPFSRLIHPSREFFHAVDSPMGRAVDMHGRLMKRKDILLAVGSNPQMMRRGNGGEIRDDYEYVGASVRNPANTAAVTTAGVVINIDDVINQPYEFETDQPVGNDRPFNAAEFHSLVKRGTADVISRRLVELLGDVADSNEAIDRLITFDSRSLDIVEIPGMESVVQYMVDHLDNSLTPAQINEQIERIVALELRKGGRFNLNRPLGNGLNDSAQLIPNPNIPNNLLTDETAETQQANPNTVAAEYAFPQLTGISPPPLAPQPSAQTPNYNGVRSDYLPMDSSLASELPSLTAGELLARQLYYVMFRLILDPEINQPVGGVVPANKDANNYATVVLVPNFPYPAGMIAPAADAEFCNRYVARRLAQWAVNAVDIRDTNAIMTRLRFDPNPFDNNGFDLATAAENVVWGMERRELELTETISFHDRRVKRNLHTVNPTTYNPNDTEPVGGPNPEYVDDEADNDPNNAPNSDQDLDQFRIPEASSFVELRSLRSPPSTYTDPNSPTPRTLTTQDSYPAELYDLSIPQRPRLDLGRTVSDPNNAATESPVWRLAVGYTDRDHQKSALWVNEAKRVSEYSASVNQAGYTGNLPDPLGLYANASADYDPANPAVGDWVEKLLHVADAVSPVTDPIINPNPLPFEKDVLDNQIFLFDDDLDPSSVPANVITLERFVWFASLRPDSVDISDPANPASSGMRPDNVFFASGVFNDNTRNFDNVPALLEGGQYAVVAPRTSTILGSTAASMAPEWFYRPSRQRMEFTIINGSRQFRYIDLAPTPNPNSGTPTQEPTGNYRARSILPIIATSLPPHEADQAPLDPVLAGWNTDYFGLPLGTLPLEDRVSVGFNISAPLSGRNYYPHPTQYIYNDPNGNNADNYEFRDGYRDYVNGVGLHADVPFDEITDGTKPLQSNGWLGVGAYQDVATLFLQRLADPTRPWSRADNPYITVDMLSMDLTVFNGEENLKQVIDRDGDGNAQEPVDPHTPMYPTEIAFDTRRKIPDSRRQRPLTGLVPRNLVGDLEDIANYDRVLFVQRSPLMSLQSLLRNRRERGTAAATPYFDFELTSAWANDVPNPAARDLDTFFGYDKDQHWFDRDSDDFPQTLGFVNREFGEPAQAFTWHAGANPAFPAGAFVGYPIGVSLLMPNHSDRPFQSPYELIQVPATSASRLNMEFSPGTDLPDSANVTVASRPMTGYVNRPSISAEKPGRFTHLLGFEQNLGDEIVNPTLPEMTNPIDVTTINFNARQIQSNTTNGVSTLTGDRAGFEQIFDVVDTGPVSFGQRRWIDPRQASQIVVPTNPPPPVDRQVRGAIFNRVVSTLHAPFNYVDRHRTEGKINLNTTPDYIRRGASFSNAFPATSAAFQRPLDAGEYPNRPDLPGALGGIGAEPSNYRVWSFNDPVFGTDPIYSSLLYGNGSVYRSLAWGNSTFYELDDDPGSPPVAGQRDLYKRGVDSRFGLGFKGFIESRRGYATSYLDETRVWATSKWSLPGGTNPIPNLDLDFRYPSRFAGVFAPAAGAKLPSVQTFLRTGGYYPNQSWLRRTHDMSLLRPHPDFDIRLMDDMDADDTPPPDPNFQENPGDDDRDSARNQFDAFVISTETNPTTPPVLPPSWPYVPPAAPYGVAMPRIVYPNGRIAHPAAGGQPTQVAPNNWDLKFSLVNTGLFERPQAELERDFRQMARDPMFRFQNASRLANLTTHHSNVFMVRFTLGYFQVDPNTGALGREYVDPREGYQRPKGFYLIDRSIPVGYEPGQRHNSTDTILFSSVEE